MNVNKIREDFPLLKRRINGKKIVYFDSACMSLKPKQVINAMLEYYELFPSCVGRSTHRLGNEATEAYMKAREEIANFINARPEEIVFLKNATEAINLVAHSFDFKKGDVVITTDKEHNSNMLPWKILEERAGIKHVIIKTTKHFDFDRFEKNVKKAKLVSVVHISNFDGSVMPIKEIIEIAHGNDVPVLIDAAQSVPHTKIDVKKLDADFIAFSGHKMLGPTGTGCLYGKYEALKSLKPFITGGETVSNTTYKSYEMLDPPERFEAGLQNYAGFIGLGEAARYLRRVGLDNIEEREEKINRKITKSILDLGFSIIGPKDARERKSILSFYKEGIDVYEVALLLDEMANIMVRAGKHCAHSWFNSHGIKGSVRLSFYLYNTLKEAEIFIKSMQEIVKIFKR
ncbi:MAG TPA: cysteine desulfurase [Candidatus Aenigmarchaeota archaeon]|nr:cysteine desulfurase [Candidatus Aenigmarchaeota archaeon]